MSTTTPHVAIDTSRNGIPFGRLAKVEIRKMFDTLAGRWLMIITGLLLLLALGLTLLVVSLNDGVRVSADVLSQILTVPLSLLLPVFAIVTVTGEWGQRTHLTLFTLEPHRLRVFLAKLVAVLVLAIGTIVAAIVLGVIGTALASVIGGYDANWNVDASDLAWTVGLQLAYFLMAFALATVFLSTPLAVVVFYVVALLLPLLVYSTLTAFFEWARDLIPWVDFNYAAAPLISGMDFIGEPVDVGVIDYARFIVSITIWVVIPLVIGFNRVVRSEVK